MAQRKLLILVFLSLIVVAVQGQKTQRAREQTRFSQDYGNPNQHAVPVSPEVLKVLLKAPEVKETLEEATESAQQNPAQLFTAAEVHLGPANEVDLVVYSIFPLTGGDNDWFWVVLFGAKKPQGRPLFWWKLS